MNQVRIKNFKQKIATEVIGHEAILSVTATVENMARNGFSFAGSAHGLLVFQKVLETTGEYEYVEANSPAAPPTKPGRDESPMRDPEELFIRCKQCGGRVVWKRVDGEILLLHSCWSPRQWAIAEAARQMAEALNAYLEEPHGLADFQCRPKFQAAIEAYKEAKGK